MIVEKDHELYKVQVKTTTYKNEHGTYIVGLANRYGDKFDGSKVDYLFIVTAEYEMYLIPTGGDFPGSRIALGKNKDEFRVV